MECIQENFIEKTQKISIYINRYIHQIKFLDERVEIIREQLDIMQKDYLEQYKQAKEKKNTQNNKQLKELKENVEKLQREYITYSHEKMKLSDQLVELSKESQDLFAKYQEMLKEFDVYDQKILEEEQQQVISPQKPVKGRASQKSRIKEEEKKIQIEQQYLIQQEPTLEVYCTCKGAVQENDMICCENDNCPIQWYHFSCVGIKVAPDGAWYCQRCKNINKKQSNQKNKKSTVNS